MVNYLQPSCPEPKNMRMFGTLKKEAIKMSFLHELAIFKHKETVGFGKN
ncbi:hypothetical protein SAMN05216480_111106 [Pustulibacterium marinum]|uniref:Uncharacterized protein n=2 Tax=Pustulibacterium marinum TaxID=1224947 RepID=A0A1I7HWX1_9FLAO|nr:hypothetical protein SAMN05216480_111106 [Pustulibacterium marinum]